MSSSSSTATFLRENMNAGTNPFVHRKLVQVPPMPAISFLHSNRPPTLPRKGAKLVEDWRCNSAQKADQILQLYLTGMHADTVFSVSGMDVAGDIHEKSFKCHSLILSSASIFFENLLVKQKMQNTNGGAGTVEWKVDNLTPAAFDSIMKFIYGSKTIFPNVEVSMEICMAAHCWKLPRLATDADVFLLQKIQPEKLIILYEMYEILELLHNRKVVLKAILENVVIVLQSQAWLRTTKSAVRDVLASLKHIKHRLSPIRIYDYLVLWAENQVRLDSLLARVEMQSDAVALLDLRVSDDEQAAAPEADEPEEQSRFFDNNLIRCKIHDLLPLVTFENCTAKEFAELCTKDNIMTSKEKLDCLSNLVLKKKP